ncbi:MAG: LysM peptidoglycan-binding domain-containing protein [Verrucomicrobiota bacterium]
MKLPSLPFAPPRKKKLRASAARRATAMSPEFEDTGEPNMKLSRALLIVLVLHVVAVAGIIAFNAIKSRQGPIPVVTATPAPALPKAEASAAPTASPLRETKSRMSAVAAKPEKKKVEAAESGKSYTIAKGDTPVSIARKFKVPFDELIGANHIEDPRKLKIGQKIIIPAKKTTPKKNT